MAAPKKNTNAEKWTFKEAERHFLKAVEFSLNKDYDFIGEVAQAMGSYKHVFIYLSAKYPELKTYLDQIVSNCESNCFYNAKKGNIKEATAIINLKSNHGWTDRQELKHGGSITTASVELTEEQKAKLIDNL